MLCCVWSHVVSCSFLWVPLAYPHEIEPSKRPQISLVTLRVSSPYKQSFMVFFGSIELDSHLLLPAFKSSRLIRIQHGFSSSIAWVVWCQPSIFLSPLCVYVPLLRSLTFALTYDIVLHHDDQRPTFGHCHFLVCDFQTSLQLAAGLDCKDRKIMQTTPMNSIMPHC